jgi:single-strand DNA-binding protein
MNKVSLVGRLTKDPELRLTTEGAQVGNFTLAVNRIWKNADGERKADFIPVVIWRKQAEHCAKYLCKGSLVSVEGRIQVRRYEREGRTQWMTEVVAESVQFLDRRREETAAVTPVSDMFDTNANR